MNRRSPPTWAPPRLCDSFHEHPQQHLKHPGISFRSRLERPPTMTTATMSQHGSPHGSQPGPHGLRILSWSTAVVLAAGLLLALVGAVLDGRPALVGALAGAGLVALVLSSGTAVVDLVSQLMPSASLIVAMLTYTLEIAFLALVLAALNGADNLDETMSAQYFAGAVIAGALAWTVVQVRLAMSARIPVYDLPDHPVAQPSAGPTEGSER